VLSYTNISDGPSGALTLNGSKITLNNVTFQNNANCDVKVADKLAQAPGSTNKFTICPESERVLDDAAGSAAGAWR